MATSPLWVILWVLAAAITAGVMYGAWTGPHRSVSNLSRWAVRLRVPHIPEWLSARAADRWAFRGGLLSLVLLLAAAWLMPSQRPLLSPAGVPNESDASRGAVAPPPPSGHTAVDRRPERQIDADLKNAILVHIPKTKKIKLVVLSGDAEADQFSWQVDAFLRAEGYQVISPRVFFVMAAGGKTPSGTIIYPDESDPNILVIRIGLNDRG